MSRQNVEIIRRGYEHFIANGDILEEVFDPDLVLDMSTFRGWPERQHYSVVAPNPVGSRWTCGSSM